MLVRCPSLGGITETLFAEEVNLPWQNPSKRRQQRVATLFRYRPILETIEERLLPGETLGSLCWPSLDSIRDLADSSAIDTALLAAPRSSRAALPVALGGFLQPLNQTEVPVNATATERRETPSAPEHAPASDPLFTNGVIIPVFPDQLGRQHGTSGRLGDQNPSSPLDNGAPNWAGYGHDAQHTGVADVPSQPLNAIHWETPVDLYPQYQGGELLIHYGSPMITAANTVMVPVKTGPSNGFRVEARDGATGTLKWNLATDYLLPPHDWTPSFSPTLTTANRLYLAGVGGTVYYRDDVDSATGATGQLAFYGIANYDHSLDSTVFISTPITAGADGTIYFGFTVTGANALNLQSGIARIDTNGAGSWIAASAATGDGGVNHVAYNCAPALSKDGSTLYVGMSRGNQTGYLVALASTTLAPVARAALVDPNTGNNAILFDDGSASPTVGPDGDVYFGVLDNPVNSNNDRGWLLHFRGDLSQPPVAVPGAFGWDDTVSIVDSSLVPSYTGSSPYLLMTKYNNYAGHGSGNGINKIAVIDPNTPMVDPITGIQVMKEVLTIAGQTPDPEFSNYPGAVREWCINNAAVDPFTGSILANSEDGSLYRWDLTTNTFTEFIHLAQATGEAYTPTVVGADGTVYAINNATLFAVGLANSPGQNASYEPEA
jgi:hypothetical protein